MKISKVKVVEEDGHKTLSGFCDDFELYYRFPASVDVPLSADPFVAACVVPAMFVGTDIQIPDDLPVSATLLSNLEMLQTIFSFWEGQLGERLQKIGITGGRVQSEPIARRSPVGSFFSGGVDGTHTFLAHQAEIDFLLFAKGIDMQLDNDGLYQQALQKNNDYLATHGKRLVPCETNVRFLGYKKGLSWSATFGGGLASIAMAAGVGRCYLASGVTYAATAQEGSNYITDRLWSSGHTEILHDGADTSRIEKIRRLAEDDEALNILRVCWHDQTYNCGECEKCLRTMTSLRVLGLSTPNFPELTDSLVRSRLAKLRIYSDPNLGFLEENMQLAHEKGDDVVYRALRSIRRNFLLRKHARGLIDAFR